MNSTAKHKIEALHTFHNTEYAIEWAQRFDPTPERIRLFDSIYSRIAQVIELSDKKENICVVELGVGPGYLAEYLLQQLGQIQYTAFDFSLPMLDIARQRLDHHMNRISMFQGDFIKRNWMEQLKNKPDVFVSTWTLHDLFDPANIFNVYSDCYELLPTGGLLLNGDFIKPEGTSHPYEGGRIEISKHLKMLNEIGYKEAYCKELFESNPQQPTTSNNYALIEAIR